MTFITARTYLLLLGGLIPATLAAQQPADAPAPSPAAVAGLTVAPKWGQSKEQQLQSEEECYARARGQTGFDPVAIAPADSAAAQPDTFVAGVVSGRRLARADAQRADALVRFRQAMTACLEGGGYTVQ